MNPNAIRMEIVMRLILGAESDEELREAKRKAEQIKAMSDEEILSFVREDDEDEPEPEDEPEDGGEEEDIPPEEEGEDEAESEDIPS